MSRGGPYQNFTDQPPAGWTHTDQLLWLEPDDDDFTWAAMPAPNRDLPIGGTGSRTRTPEAGFSPSSGPSRACARLHPPV